MVLLKSLWRTAKGFKKWKTIGPKKGVSLSQARPVLPRIAAGDHAAVDECLQRYGGLVWSLARRRCADVQLIEDAVQNIFLHLWEVAATFDENVATETTFIAMVARRRLIDYQRKQMTRKDVSHSEFDHLQHDDAGPTTHIEIIEEAARAERLLNRLPPDQQRVLRLSIYDGLSHSKISELTGLKLGTVKTYIRRGLTKIRDSLFQDTADVRRKADNRGNASNARDALNARENVTKPAEKSTDSKIYARSRPHHHDPAPEVGGLQSN